ncbi:MAG: nicotinamide mononucleotide transporter family protein, partial [Bacteroidales bacterium]|nr:nicotinamide mononucleotide transporter family protein [Bacteroidales bacterium]
MLARKILEHWFIWVLVNIVSVGLYIYKGLYPTVVLFIVYATMAIVGYFEWRKEMRVNAN